MRLSCFFTGIKHQLKGKETNDLDNIYCQTVMITKYLLPWFALVPGVTNPPPVGEARAQEAL